MHSQHAKLKEICMGVNVVKEQITRVVEPGDKIYSLFGHKEVLVQGKQEQFIIRIEKIDDERKRNGFQHVRAMG